MRKNLTLMTCLLLIIGVGRLSAAYTAPQSGKVYRIHNSKNAKVIGEDGIAREFEHQPEEFTPVPVDPKEPPEYRSMIATAYCLTGLTATETQARPGIAASKREWFGRTAKVYRNDGGNVGELIGTYVIEDTGGRAIRNGSVIDIWLPTEAEWWSDRKSESGTSR